MEALYGVMLLITFLLGVGMGLSIPFLVKKYIKQYKEIEPKIEQPKEPEKNNEIPYIPKDLLNEWMTGEEVKPNDKQ